MAIRKILHDTDPLLRKVSREVTEFDQRLHDLLDDMADTLEDAQGAGLAAPQVGVLRRAVIVDVGDGVIELINPVRIAYSGKQTGDEGCLSVPDKKGIVCRPYRVTVRAQDRYGEFFEIEGEGFLARAFGHEMDHLEGILYTDIMIKDSTYDDNIEEVIEE